MFDRIIARIEARRSLRFLLSRADEHLLRDIGLSRAEAMAMLDAADPLAAILPARDPRGGACETC
ncbi:MAG: DUF1127 domain-containing protein [Paracoccaceae bacterium]